jgi:hypothetical protein
MKNISILLLVMFASVFCFAEVDDGSEKLRFYLAEAGVAAKERDFSYACDLLKRAVYFAKTSESGRHLEKVQQSADAACEASHKQLVQNYQNTIKNHPYYPLCGAFRSAKQQCAGAAAYGNCMGIKFGARFQSVQDSMVCN